MKKLIVSGVISGKTKSVLYHVDNSAMQFDPHTSNRFNSQLASFVTASRKTGRVMNLDDGTHLCTVFGED